jgi:CheY-like chemotaxis protein
LNSVLQPVRRVLLADDDASTRLLAHSVLSGAGFQVFLATNGEEAIENVIIEQPDLVVLDVMMPEVNGWEVCRYIKERDTLRDIRVIMLTGIGHNLNAMTSPLYGADAYLDKPFDLDQLEATVLELLGADGISRNPG